MATETYRKKATATVEVVKFTGTNFEEIEQDTKGKVFRKEFKEFVDGIFSICYKYYVHTLEGDMEFTPGCFIAIGDADDVWAIQPDRFAATYEKAV